MAIVATAEFFMKPEKAEEFVSMLQAALPDTRAYEGCEGVETHINQDDPNHLFLIERWGARSDHEAYLAWRAETGMMDTVGDYLSGPPKFTYLDARPEV
jgi:quinol monooxygenase YgiN